MIYVEESSFERQLSVLEHIAGSIDCLLVAWLYPESSTMEVAGLAISDEATGLVPVTTYEDGTIASHTVCCTATPEVFDRLRIGSKDISAHCDSIALYPLEDDNWIACTVGHERMCLVSQDAFLSDLVSANIKATNEPPEWW